MATAAKPAPATPGAFTLDDETVKYVDTLPARGPATPPKLLDAVTEAVSTGDRKGLTLAGDLTDPKGLDKAARTARQDLNRAAAALARTLDGEVVRVVSKVVRDHPKLGTFLAWSAHREPITTDDTK